MARCLLRILALVGAFLAIAPVAQAAQCGLPDAAPWWIDFSDGSVSFRETVFKHPGVIVGVDGHPGPGVAACRRRADGVLVDAPRPGIVGTPSAPRPAADIPAAAQHAARVGAGVVGLRDAGHRAERARRPGLADSLVGVHRRVSRERPGPRHGVDARRRAAVPAGARHAAPAEPRGRCRSLVAAARDRVGHRARGLRAGAADLLGRRRCSGRARCASRSARRSRRSWRSACPRAGSA